MSIAADGPTSWSADARWGDRIPWYLRYPNAALSGDVDRWLSLVGQRLQRLCGYNEANFANPEYLGACLESETLGQFKYQLLTVLDVRLRTYFDPAEIYQEADSDLRSDESRTEVE